MAFEEFNARPIEQPVPAGEVIPESRFSLANLMSSLGLRKADSPTLAAPDAHPTPFESTTTVDGSNVRTLTTQNPDGDIVRVVQSPNGYRSATSDTVRVASSPIDPFEVHSFDTSTGAHIIAGNQATEIRPAHALQWSTIKDGVLKYQSEDRGQKFVAGEGNPDFHRIVLQPGETFWDGTNKDHMRANGSLTTYRGSLMSNRESQNVVFGPDGSLTTNHVARVFAGTRGGYQPTRYANDWSVEVDPTGAAKFKANTDVFRAKLDYPVAPLAGLDPAKYPKGTTAEATLSAAGNVDANFGPLAHLRVSSALDESSGARLVTTETPSAQIQALDLTNGDRVMLRHPIIPEVAIREGASASEVFAATMNRPESGLRIVATDGLYIRDKITGPGHFVSFSGAVKPDLDGAMLKGYLAKNTEVGKLLPTVEDAVGSIGRMLASAQARELAARAIGLIHA